MDFAVEIISSQRRCIAYVQRASRNIVTRLNLVGRSSDIREHLRSHRSREHRRTRRDKTSDISLGILEKSRALKYDALRFIINSFFFSRSLTQPLFARF